MASRASDLESLSFFIMIGIYKITNPKGKVYIGQAVDITRRENVYKRLNCKGQIKLYNSLLKYGFSEHIFEVVEECNVEELNERERHWQDFYNVLEEGLNLKLTETLDRSGRMSKESIERKIKNTDYIGRSIKFNKPILQYSLEGIFLKEWDSSTKAGEALGISKGNITNCCKGVFNQSGGFIWKYKTSITYEQIKPGKIGREVVSEKLSKPVLQYSLNNTLIKEWDSMILASKTLNLNRGNITSCCKGKNKSVGGFIWKYKFNSN